MMSQSKKEQTFDKLAVPNATQNQISSNKPMLEQARLGSVVNLVENCKPSEWNNIPVPVVETTSLQLKCFEELGGLYAGIHNDVLDQKKLTQSQAKQCKRESESLRNETTRLVTFFEDRMLTSIKTNKQEIDSMLD